MLATENIMTAKEKETKLYQWLMLHVATKVEVEGEKLLSLHHPFETQINE